MNKISIVYPMLSLLAGLFIGIISGVGVTVEPRPESVVSVDMPLCESGSIQTVMLGEPVGCDLDGSQTLVVMYMPEVECDRAGGQWVKVRGTALCADVDY